MAASRVAALSLCLVLAMTTAEMQIRYPETRKTDQADDYFGRTVADPYRWLEDDNSAETAAWVEAQNKVTFDYLAKIPAREPLKARLTTLWNFERYGTPSREGEFYIFARNDGLQNQSVVYRAKTLDAAPEVLIDPNTLSADGTVALADTAFTDDGRLMAYALAKSGSDWHEWRVREVATGKDLPDVVEWSKFSGAAWLKDGSGFYYGRFDAPKAGDELQAVNQNQRIYFHKIGTAQTADALIYERPDHPTWGFSPVVTDDGRYLLVYQSEGTENKNRIFVQDLSTPGSKLQPFLDTFDAYYTVVGNDGRHLLRGDRSRRAARQAGLDRAGRAAAGGVEAADRRRPEPRRPRRGHDARRSLRRHLADRRAPRAARLRSQGHVRARGRPADAGLGRLLVAPARSRGFYSFTSFTYPSAVYRYDPAAGTSAPFRALKLAFTPSDFETTQVFYTSKDGTKIPMFITGRKGFVRDGKAPTILYGYGGFNISLTPAFSVGTVAWLEHGGLYAVPNLRGGGEYGKVWHDAGRLQHKQNVFDDFIAAAEYLITEKYTSTPRLAISGGSNGGLLVGAAMTQRPDLFGAALPAVGVMDMLRFHKFTIGWAWKSDYGSSETRTGFDTLISVLAAAEPEAGDEVPGDAGHDRRSRRSRGAGAQLQVRRRAAGGAGRPGAGADPHRDQGRTRRRQADQQADRRARRRAGVHPCAPSASSSRRGPARTRDRAVLRVRAADRSEIAIEPGQDRGGGVVDGHGVSGFEDHVLLLIRGGAQRVEERALRRVDRRREVVAAVEQHRRHVDARGVVDGPVLRRLIAPDAGALQDAGLQARLERGEDRAGVGAGADAVEADAGAIDVRPRLEIVDAAAQLPRPRDALSPAPVLAEVVVAGAFVGAVVDRIQQGPAAAHDERRLADRQVAARSQQEGVGCRKEDDRLIGRLAPDGQEEKRAQAALAAGRVDRHGDPRPRGGDHGGFDDGAQRDRVVGVLLADGREDVVVTGRSVRPSGTISSRRTAPMTPGGGGRR
jgi:prolyl oligopeptidase